MTQDFQPSEIQQELVTLASNVDVIRRFRYQDVDLAVMSRELLPAVEAVTGELIGALDRLETHYKEEGDAGPLSGAGMVADISAMSRQEVSDRLGRLKGEVRGVDNLEVIIRSMSLLGTLRRTTVVVENLLADQLELRRRLRSQGELDLLLEIRAAAVEIALSLGDAEPRAAELVDRLRPVEPVLSGLVARDLYWELPDGPRRVATDLLARTRIWVGGGDGHDSISGRHLWRALRTFVDGIFKVNERNELLEYDRSIIRMAHGAIFGRGAPSGRVPPTLLKQLRRIAGRDAMIDRLLATGDADPQKWAEPLQRLRESL